MIAYLAGTLSSRTPGTAVVDVHGVGYAVHIPLSTYSRLPAGDAQVRLFTHLSVRENAMELFGFLSASERDLFERLIQVSGVGPKLGLRVLSAMEPDEFRLAVVAGDTRALSRVPGVGRKTAERLVIELRDTLAQLPADMLPGQAAAPGDPQAEAVMALVSLGLKQAEAAAVVRQIAPELEAASTEQLVKEALRRL